MCGDGVSRTLSSITFSPGHAGVQGKGCGLANNGWLTFAALFTDGRSGLFRTKLSECEADLGSSGGLAGSDGALDNNDFIVFISAFFAGDPAADVGEAGGWPGGDTLLDNNDFIVFIDRFFTGC
ncbi:MAG: GC-type dockerin domain-anchored protein [Phycisphaerales bacterium]